MTDELFLPGITHVEVKCWDCGHLVTRLPSDMPDGITQHEFERRAVCKCGTGWPQVARHPRKAPTSMYCWSRSGIISDGCR
tara:strand:+ start:1335 stop:1577 length:243 start_codon:yes stop_codon:yes gene_type:complete